MNCVCGPYGPCNYHARNEQHPRRAWWAWVPRSAVWLHWAFWNLLWRVEYPTWQHTPDGVTAAEGEAS